MKFKINGTDDSIEGIRVKVKFILGDWDEVKDVMMKIDEIFGS